MVGCGFYVQGSLTSSWPECTFPPQRKPKRINSGWFFVFLQLPFCLVRQTILSLISASISCSLNASSSFHLVRCLRRDSRKNVPYLRPLHPRTKVISSSLVKGVGRIIEYRRTTLGQLSSFDNSGNNGLTLGRTVREVNNVRLHDKVNTVNLGLPKMALWVKAQA